MKAYSAGLAVLLAAGALVAHPRAAEAKGGRNVAVSVSPFGGDNSEPLRRQVTRLMRGRGFSVVTSLPRVDDSTQYPPLAREHHLAAFLTGDVETRQRARTPARQTVTFVVWNGATGAELGRWSATGAPRRLPSVVARGFFKNLGRAFQAADPPPPPPPPPSPSPSPSEKTPAPPPAGNASPSASANASEPAHSAPADRSLIDLANQVSENHKLGISTQTALNIVWTLLTGFLVMFMQAGFAMVEAGFTRAKNLAHTLGINFLVYSIGGIGYWAVGFALQMGGVGALSTFGNDATLSSEFVVTFFGKDFGLFGMRGFFLSPEVYTAPVAALFLFQIVFMDTMAIIPTGAMAERWKFSSFVLFTFVLASFTYPIFGNWVWGGGWLSQLGHSFHLGHGHVDFAGSSVVHLAGGVAALVGAKLLGPRIGKYDATGNPRPIPAHNMAMGVLGTFILAFGWFGFNAGSTLAGSDTHIAIIAVNTMLASASGAFGAYLYMKLRFGKPELGMMCNGMLAGLVAITAPCAFVTSPAAIFIGAVAGVLVIVSAMYLENRARIDDPAGAISVHGTCGAWGILSLGLLADGRYGEGWNGVPGTVRGLFYGDPSQLVASLIGIIVCVAWTGGVTYGAFRLIDRLVGNRSTPQEEMAGLDVPEFGVEGYATDKGDVPGSGWTP
ncbi:MAG TPA: ammonium transporter [Polyangia bacterium]|nr:ammonium transporter [Polyangia bacterium]